MSRRTTMITSEKAIQKSMTRTRLSVHHTRASCGCCSRSSSCAPPPAASWPRVGPVSLSRRSWGSRYGGGKEAAIGWPLSRSRRRSGLCRPWATRRRSPTLCRASRASRIRLRGFSCRPRPRIGRPQAAPVTPADLPDAGLFVGPDAYAILITPNRCSISRRF